VLQESLSPLPCVKAQVRGFCLRPENRAFRCTYPAGRPFANGWFFVSIGKKLLLKNSASYSMTVQAIVYRFEVFFVKRLLPFLHLVYSPRIQKSATG
jgi:hypothetical protein